MYIGLAILLYLFIGIICSYRWSYLFGDRTPEATVAEILMWPIGIILEIWSNLE